MVSAGDGKCEICNKKSARHEPTACPKRKGCCKCGKPTDHKASNCKVWGKNYSAAGVQLCCYCLSPEHERKDCNDAPDNKFCTLCGHSDHMKPKCPFSAESERPSGLPQSSHDQFTPKFKTKYERKIDTSLNTPPTPIVPPISATSSVAPASNSPVQAASNTPAGPASGVARGDNPQGNQVPTPIKKAEDSDAAKHELWEAANQNLPKKPVNARNATGTTQEKIQGNFFKIGFDRTKKLFRYRITIGDLRRPRPQAGAPAQQAAPNNGQERRRMSRETTRFMIDRLLEVVNPRHGGWVTDYHSLIISAQELYPNSMVQGGRVWPHPRDANDPDPPVQSRIEFVDHVNLDGLKRHIDGLISLPSIEEELSALKIISWKLINDASFTGGRVGNKFFPVITGSDDGNNRKILKIRNGFFTSIRPGEGNVYLNINPITSAFYSPINLQTWMEVEWGAFDPQNPIRPNDFKRRLKNIRVTFEPAFRNPVTTGSNNTNNRDKRKFIINSVSNLASGNQTFNDGTTIRNVLQYLQSKYTSHRWMTNSYCINVGGAANQIWFPADQLKIVDWQILNEKVPEAYSVEMVRTATRSPLVNKDLILKQGLRALGIQPLNSFYKKFGIIPIPQLADLTSTILKPPRLIFSPENKLDVFNGAWNLAKQKQLLGPPAEKPTTLFVLNLTSKNRLTQVPALSILWDMLVNYQIISQQVARNGRPNRDIKEQPVDVQQGNQRQQYVGALNNARQNFQGHIPFFLVILETKDIPSYQHIKWWSDCVAGIPTVCVTRNVLGKIQKRDLTTCANVCLKINLKLKGISHTIESDLTRSINTRGPTGAYRSTMIVGADVTHPGKHETVPSMAAVVATHDTTSTKYLGSARLQRGKREYIEDLKGMMVERINAWVKKAEADGITNLQGKLPQTILFYRDGVSESQYGMVDYEEKPQILAGCAEALEILNRGQNPKVQWVPKLTIIVVAKRHHARFYPKTTIDPRQPNLASGTLVDKDVVTPNHWSFYLQSHSSPLGTARSAHYVVIYDDVGYSAEDLQKITHSICFTSARATKAVSHCTPARYADLLCNRLRCYMRPVLADSNYLLPNERSPGKRSPTDADLDARQPGDYAADTDIWRVHPAPRKNPWAERLDDTMFYL